MVSDAVLEKEYVKSTPMSHSHTDPPIEKTSLLAVSSVDHFHGKIVSMPLQMSTMA
jgi:hypothetical protein